jgi:murein DD-endopeptidase MepM/ murein hydrolase activator NlpD
MRRSAPLIGVLLSAAVAAPSAAHAATAPPLLFPVVGGASYIDDYGDPRPQGRHEGNDLMADKRTPVVAVANGVVTLQHSNRGGYMLYLRNAKHEWLYIHLNNDIRGNDGRGGRRTAYARGLRSGMRVKQGQEIAYVGNSGDAEGGPAHLHFEEHSASGRPHDPYRHLRAAPVVLFSAPATAGKAASLVAPLLLARLMWVADGDDGVPSRIGLRLSNLKIGTRSMRTRRGISVRVSPAVIAALGTIRPGRLVRVGLTPTALTLSHQMMRAGVWEAATIAAR